MIFPRPDYEPTAYDDDWEDIPASGPFPKWFGGVIVPLTLVLYGMAGIITQHALVGHQMPLELHGMRAVADGTASVSLGLFLHFHFFWGNIYHLSAWSVLGKIISMVVLIGSIGYLLVRVGIFGEN